MKDTKKATDVQGILWSARLGLSGHSWHLGNRAIPAIKELAGRLDESRLPEAAEHVTRARQLIDEAKGLTGRAIDILERYVIIEPDDQPSAST